MDADPSRPSYLRRAYLPDRRVRLAANLAGLCAVGLLVGVLGAAVTWWGRSALFDFAQSPNQVVRLGLGYLFGPLAILVALPLILPRRRQLALKRWYRRRLAVAGLLWIAGLVVLVEKVAGLDGYTITAGTYVAAALLVIGIATTAAMWPAGLREVDVDRAGRLYDSRHHPADRPAPPTR
jgi:hypothetical protein